MEYYNMLTLYGFPASNYYGLIKHALLLKGIDFKEERTYPGHSSYLDKSPMGKVPCIGTEHGFYQKLLPFLSISSTTIPTSQCCQAMHIKEQKALN
jgi:glutathione S-transferase